MKIFFSVLFVLCSVLYSQEVQEDYQKIPSRYGYEIFRPAVVGFNYFIDFDEQTLDSLFYLSVSIQNDFLQFKVAEDDFISRYQVSLLVRSEKGTVLSQTWQEEFYLSDFDKTNSLRDFQRKTYVINLKKEKIHHLSPGEYEVLVEVSDLQSSIQYKNIRKMQLKEDQSNNYTEIVFKPQEDENNIITHISDMRDHVNFNEPYIAYAHIKSKRSGDGSINARLFKNKKDEQILLDQSFIEDGLQLDRSFKINYSLPFEKMDEGQYLLRFLIENGNESFKIEKEFQVLWLYKPLYLYKTDLAVRPMKYLLDKNEMEEVKNYDLQQLDEWFRNYWKSIDPTPGTAYNELQHVFYTRVSEAVRDYSTRFKEGWQTDLGMVWVLYGEPTEIENRRYSVNSIPHIIWKYKNDEGLMEFTFADKEKNGNFVLVETKNE